MSDNKDLKFINTKFFIPKAFIKVPKIEGGSEETCSGDQYNKLKLYEPIPKFNGKYDSFDFYKQFILKKYHDIFREIFDANPEKFQNYQDPILSFDDLNGSLKYESPGICWYSIYIRALHDSIHKGQRKLLISEIQSLVNNLDSFDQEGIVVYAGAAPCMKLWLYMRLFPNLKFILVDPNEFYIYWGEYGKPHYIADTKGEVCYLSYSDSNMYNSDNIHWNRKKINFYDTKTKSLRVIMDKQFGLNLSPEEVKKYIISGKIRNVSNNFNFNIYHHADQDSFDYIFNSNHRVFICEEYFTSNIAQMIRNSLDKVNYTKKFIFWTDIRTVVDGKEPSDTDVIWNNAITYSWLRIMKPDVSMIKFRLPYFNEGDEFYHEAFENDFNEAKNLGCDFIEGVKERKGLPMIKCNKIYLQTWQGQTSTEARGEILKQDILDNNLIFYNVREYEDKFYFYNKIMRFLPSYKNDNADYNFGFDHCNDCAIENHIWTTYKKKYNLKDFNIIYWIKFVGSVTGYKLNDTFFRGHGLAFNDIELDMNKINSLRSIGEKKIRH